jgi:hypothetical protein
MRTLYAEKTLSFDHLPKWGQYNFLLTTTIVDGSQRTPSGLLHMFCTLSAYQYGSRFRCPHETKRNTQKNVCSANYPAFNTTKLGNQVALDTVKPYQ